MNQRIKYLAGKSLITTLSIFAIIGFNAILNDQYDKIIDKEKGAEGKIIIYINDQEDTIKSREHFFPLSINWESNELIFRKIDNDNLKSGKLSDLAAKEAK